MSSHLAAEALSAYLDQELAERESDRVAVHLAGCQHCQQRLDGLRRVVAQLSDVGPVTLPSFLGQQVYHRISLEAKPRSRFERFEARLRRVSLAQPSILFIFALVMLLVVVVYFFTTSLQQIESPRVPVVQAPQEVAEGRRVAVGERSFVFEQGLWREVGIAGNAVVSGTIEDGSAARHELLREQPGVGDLLSSGDGVVLLWRGEVVLLRPPPNADPPRDRRP